MSIARCFCILGIALGGTSVEPALAASGGYSEARVSVGNIIGSTGYLYALDMRSSFLGALSQTSFVSQDFTGLNYDGAVDSMHFSGEAAASSQAGMIKARSSFTLADAIANQANPNYVNTNFSTNAGGVPEYFNAWSIAYWHDGLKVLGQGISYVTIRLHLTGHLNRSGALDGYSSFIAVRQNDGGGPFGTANDIFYGTNWGSYDLSLQSYPIHVNNGTATYGISLETEAGTYVSPWSVQYQGRDAATSVDFFHTLGIAEIAAFAADDRPIYNFSVTSDSGFQYITAVPEISTQTLLALGGLLLAWRVRRRSLPWDKSTT